jgi:asparagine synthase (glutamine-hydrolysing)
MCGIAGYVAAPGGEPRRTPLERMVATLHHRGPDDSGIEIVGSVGLGHTRLAIVDPSPAGHQPMADAAGRWWVTYNGEIFNHRELRAELPQVRWRGGSDTETLLEALAAWGPQAVSRCNGLYAFAALDRERDRLYLVRDRFGVKPLYYARHDGALWFASEMRALLEAGLPRRLEGDLLAHSIGLQGWANGPDTPLEGVRRVLPGTWLEIDLKSLRILRERRWYEPVVAVDPERAAALEHASRDTAAGLVEDALRTSVRRRLMADVPVGTMCSGGIDSSLIAAYAADDHPRIHAFNASVADQPEWDEGPFAARVAKELGLQLHTVRMTAASWRAGLVSVVRHMEYPLNHMSSVPMSQIADLARAEGVKVLLSGEGADELFGGYPWLNPAEVSDFAARRHGPDWYLRVPYRALQRRGVVRRGHPYPLRGAAGSVNRYEARVLRQAHRAYGHHRGPRRRMEALLTAYLRVYLPHLLNRQDKSTMLASVETRVPFLDPDVVALALNLPLEMKLEPERKALLRELFRRRLPPELLERPKVGFGWDVHQYLTPAARPEFLADGLLREALRVPAQQWRRRIGALDGYLALVHWTGEIWCRLILAGDRPEVVEEALWREPQQAAHELISSS